MNKNYIIIGAAILLGVALLWSTIGTFSMLYLLGIVAFAVFAKNELLKIKRATWDFTFNFPTRKQLADTIGGRTGEKLLQMMLARNITNIGKVPGDLNSLHPQELGLRKFTENELHKIDSIRKRLIQTHERQHASFLLPRTTISIAVIITIGIGIIAPFVWNNVFFVIAMIGGAIASYAAGHQLGDQSIPDQHAGVITIGGGRLSFPLYLDEGGHVLPFPFISMEGPVSMLKFRVVVPASKYQTQAGDAEDSIGVLIGDSNSPAITLLCEATNPRVVLENEGESVADDSPEDRREGVKAYLRAAGDKALFTSITGRLASNIFGSKTNKAKTAKKFDSDITKILQEIEEQIDDSAVLIGFNILEVALGNITQSEEIISGNELVTMTERLMASSLGMSRKEAMDRAQIQMGTRQASQQDSTYDVGGRLGETLERVLVQILEGRS